MIGLIIIKCLRSFGMHDAAATDDIVGAIADDAKSRITHSMNGSFFSLHLSHPLIVFYAQFFCINLMRNYETVNTRTTN